MANNDEKDVVDKNVEMDEVDNDSGDDMASGAIDAIKGAETGSEKFSLFKGGRRRRRRRSKRKSRRKSRKKSRKRRKSRRRKSPKKSRRRRRRRRR